MKRRVKDLEVEEGQWSEATDIENSEGVRKQKEGEGGRAIGKKNKK